MLVTAAVVQLEALPGEISNNLARADELVDRAIRAGSQLVLLPEMFATGYVVDERLSELCEGPDSRVANWLSAKACSEGVWIVGGFAVQLDDHRFNAMMFAGARGERLWYAKRELDPTERRFFSVGTFPAIVATPFGRVGCAICSDLRPPRLVRPLVGAVDVVLAAQATLATRDIGRWIAEQERSSGMAWVGPHARAIGAPLFWAGLVGPMESSSGPRGWYRGNSQVVAADGRSLAGVGWSG